MSKEKFYKCIPELNKECKKSNCFINGGECENTIYKEYTLKGLLEKIERLNNIIDKLEIEIEIGTGKYAYDTDYTRGLRDAFIYMNDRLQELKGGK